MIRSENPFFVAPHVRQLMLDQHFELTIGEDEVVVWHAFKSVWSGLLGNHKEEYDAALVDEPANFMNVLGITCNWN